MRRNRHIMRLFAAICIVALLGAGCSTNPDTAHMTPDQLERAMDLEMRTNPPVYLPEIEMAMQAEEARGAMTGEKKVSGAFREKARMGQGTATITRKDGTSFLVLDDAFKTENGPQLHVFLAGHPDPGSDADMQSMGDLDVGPLKSLSGAQVYEIPEAKAGEEWRSGVGYCVPFKVGFTAASLN